MHADVDPMFEKGEAAHVNCDDSDDKNSGIFGFFWWWLHYITSS